MSNARVRDRRTADLLGADFATGREELARAFREEAQRVVDEHLTAGRVVYGCGIGDDADRLFMLTPDGKRYEYRIRPDGTREIVRELAP